MFCDYGLSLSGTLLLPTYLNFDQLGYAKWIFVGTKNVDETLSSKT